MTDTCAAPYREFAQALVSARLLAGIKRQADLANLLNVKQQTVSRWEAGTHRPSGKQLPAIAASLNLNLSDLRTLLGDERPAGQSFNRPLPLEALAPDTFEQFIADLIQAEHPGAQVRRAGKTGHKQEGLDVRAILENGELIDAQCKRVETFGEAKVKAAVRAYSGNAARKVLALSRIASPAADIATRAAGWEMWDQDDLSRRLRALSPEKQNRLVDTYFRGQRRALLGRDDPGPWRTIDEFYRPFCGKPVFNHDLPLVGREAELAEIIRVVGAHNPNILIISAPGGMGKSKILKTAMSDTQIMEIATTVRFLSDSTEVTRRDLEDLGPGSKIVIIDDAHNRTGLAPIFEFAADLANQARVVVATRPYALDRIRRDAARFGISATKVIELAPLSNKKLVAITSKALQDAGAPDEWAPAIVQASGRSPLIATMAARIVAAHGISPELAKNIDEFRNMVMSRFTDILAYNLFMPENREKAALFLEIVALSQPFDPQSRPFLELAQCMGIGDNDIVKIVRQLAEGGVLLQRGSDWRLMPDVIGDYLIERSCIDINGKLSPLVLRVVGSLSKSDLLKNVLLNLGRMDWRLNDGDTSSSTLLSEIWMKFDSIEDEHDSRIEAIKAVAIYQPRAAIDFIVNSIHQGRRFSSFSEILRSVFYSGYQPDEALKFLWELGRVDRRETGPNPSHPIRILNDIAEYSPEKPVSLTMRIVDFAIKLNDQRRNWDGRYTPLDLLTPALSTEGHTNQWTPRALQMMPFCVTYDAVSDIRLKVVEHVLSFLDHDDVLIATAAAKFLRNLLKEPHGLFGMKPDSKIKERLHIEFMDTLTRVAKIMNHGVTSEVFVEIARAVDWHAKYGQEPVKSASEHIQKSMPSDLEFRLKLSLLHGHGFLFAHNDSIHSRQDNSAAFLNDLVREFRDLHTTVQARFSALQRAMNDLTKAGQSLVGANAAVLAMLRRDTELARAIAQSALSRDGSEINHFAEFALWELFDADRKEAQHFTWRFLASPETNLHYSAAIAFHGIGRLLDQEDSNLLRTLLTHADPGVVIPALRLVGNNTELPELERISLLLSASLNGDERVADELCAAFVAPSKKAIIINPPTANRILEKIEAIPRFEAYWIEVLLARFSEEFPDITLDFFIRRVEAAAAEQSFRIRAVNYGPYSREKLRFSTSPDAIRIFRRAWSWMRSCSSRNIYYQEMAGNLFEAMLGRDEPVIVGLLQPLLTTAGKEDVEAITSLIRHAHHRFVLRNPKFIIELLDRSDELSPDVLKSVTETLASSALSGSWSGAPGEPMPRDIKDEQQSADVLKNLSRLSPAYRLYSIINKSAKQAIEKSRREGIQIDELERDVD